MTVKTLPLLSGLCLAVALSSAAFAQDDIDATIESSRQLDGGMALARRQIAQNDYPGALGSLERLLFAAPEAVPARLLYASLLCRLDDRQGAELELSLLAGRPIAEPDWSEVIAACGPVARPVAARRRK